MNLTKLINVNIEIFSEITEKKTAPSDVFLSKYFRNHRFIGSKERKILSELFFNYIRNTILIKSIADDIIKIHTLPTQNTNFLMTIINLILVENKITINLSNTPSLHYAKFEENNYNFLDSLDLIISSTFAELDNNKITKIISNNIDNLNKNIDVLTNLSEELYNLVYTRYSLPIELQKYLVETNYINDNQQLLRFAKSTCAPAKNIIRIVEANKNKNTVLEFFKENNIGYETTPLAPNSIKLHHRPSIINWDIYRKGMIEIQDEGSQLVSYAIAPKKNESILDACAGAGGKVLHLYDITKGYANLVATDIERKKIDEMNKRIHRLGYKGIKRHIIKPFDPTIYKKYELFDKILIDAPCSGIGTYRRNPQKKYEFETKRTADYAKTQTKLLKMYSELLKIGGTLLYTTCSIIKTENEDVVNNFLSNNPNFELLPLLANYKKNGINIPELKSNDTFLTLHPEKHNTDGFFMALLHRIS